MTCASAPLRAWHLGAVTVTSVVVRHLTCVPGVCGPEFAQAIFDLLRRELHEELGIGIGAPATLTVLRVVDGEFSYRDANLRKRGWEFSSGLRIEELKAGSGANPTAADRRWARQNYGEMATCFVVADDHGETGSRGIGLLHLRLEATAAAMEEDIDTLVAQRISDSI